MGIIRGAINLGARRPPYFDGTWLADPESTRLPTCYRAELQGASIKSVSLQSLADNSSTVSVNFVIFCRIIEDLYQHAFAKLYFVTANNEKDTVN